MGSQVNANLPGVSADEVRQALERVLHSRYFLRAPKKQKFLNLICDFYLKGRAQELNEYLIGRDVFDRNEAYEPATDPIVRVGAHDIRKKLELYYQQEGVSDDIRLEIPVGSYEPIFVRSPVLICSTPARTTRAVPSTAVPEVEGGEPLVLTTKQSVTAFWNRQTTFSLCLAAALAITVIALLYINFNLRRQIFESSTRSSPGAVYGPVWQQFLMSDEPTILVLSNPKVFRFLNAGDSAAVLQRSVALTPEQATTLMAGPNSFFPPTRTPANARLVASFDTYTGLGEAAGVQYVTELLVTARKDVRLKRSHTVSAEDLRRNNVILFGSVWANEWSGKLQLQEDFVFTDLASIENRNPLANEEKVYRSRFDEHTGLLSEDYALITVKPNISEGNVIMVLAGLRSAGTEAAAEFVTSPGHLNDLNQRLQRAGGQGGPPKYYQALLKIGVENGIPTTISLLSVHVLRGAS